MFLEIKSIEKYYGTGENRTKVLKGITTGVEKGQICVLLGPSGSGQSTLLYIIGGIEKADGGSISIDGSKIEDMNEKQLSLYRRNHLGYVFQFYNLIPNLTVKENIEVGAFLSKNPLDTDELLHTLGLWEHKDKVPSQLSGGQQQRTSIGRAIVKNPDILLCDEPTGALDYKTSKDILKLIETINQKYGNTVIIVTHNDAIKLMADKVIKLRDGNISKEYENTEKVYAEELDWYGDEFMKNPLNKRLPRELKGDIGKYIVIFIFLVATIGVVSGFLVACTSMKTAFDESFDKNNIEDGNFVLESKMTDDLKTKLEDEDLTLYDNFYKEETYKSSTYRIYKMRNDVDKIELFDGEFPKTDDEIALDRLFSENNDIKIGDKVTLDGKEYKVSGYVAFSDYTSLFKSNTDMMFEAQNFTVATVTDNAFDKISDKNLNYCYSYTFNDASYSEQEKHDKNTDIKELIAKNAELKNFIAEPDNQAIHFSGDDIGSDTSMMIILLYIVIAIMAFVFEVTTSNTIEKESPVFGSL